MAILTTTVPKAIVPGLRKLMIDGVNNTPDYVSLIANINPSSQAREIDQDYSDMTKFENVGQNGQTTYDNIQNGYTTTYTHGTYKRGLEFSKEDIDDELYATAASKRRSFMIGRAAVRTRNSEFFSIFRNAFTASYISYGDGKPFCSTLHPVPDGSFTQSNASATNAALNNTNLETLILQLQQVKDFRGELDDRGMGRLILLFPPALRKTALEITESERIAGEFSNTINVHFGGRTMQTAVKAPASNYFYSSKYELLLLCCPWISARAGGSDTAWFLLEEGEHNVNFFDRKGLEISEDIDKTNTNALKIQGYMRFSYGWSGWKSAVGSQGTGTGSYAL